MEKLIEEEKAHVIIIRKVVITDTYDFVWLEGPKETSSGT